jgi:hypothetical protein
VLGHRHRQATHAAKKSKQRCHGAFFQFVRAASSSFLHSILDGLLFLLSLFGGFLVCGGRLFVLALISLPALAFVHPAEFFPKQN